MTPRMQERLIQVAEDAGAQPGIETAVKGQRVNSRAIATDMLKGEPSTKVLTKHGARLVLSASKSLSYKSLAAAIIREAEEVEAEWRAVHDREVQGLLDTIHRQENQLQAIESGAASEDVPRIEDTSAGADEEVIEPEPSPEAE